LDNACAAVKKLLKRRTNQMEARQKIVIREMNPMTTDNTLCPLHKFNVRFISQSLWFKVATNTTLLLVTNADVFIQYITVIKVNDFGVFF
jgi:hypothetical protein